VPAECLPAIILELTARNKKIGILAFSSNVHIASIESKLIQIIPMPERAEDYAQALYASLRELDSLQLDMILVEQPPEKEAWRAINDRLRKATSSY